MRRTKADRFESMVRRHMHVKMYLKGCDSLFVSDAVQLLRQQYRAVLRLIKQTKRHYINSEFRVVQHETIQEILDRLKRRAQ